MAFAADTLRLTGLDTLSERALRRLTDRWTGELYPVDSLDVTHHAEAASPQTFTQIVEEWQRAREMYHDADVETVLGGGSSLSQGVVSMADSVATPSLTPLYDAEVMLAERGGWSLAGWSDELFNLLVAVMLVYHLFCVCRYFDDIKALFESIFNSKIQHTGRAGERRRSDIFYGSLGKLFMLGVCFVGLLTSISISRVGGVAGQMMIYVPLAVIAVFLAVIVAQYIFLGIVGFVTQSYGEVAAFMRIRLTYFVLSTVMVAPVILMALIGSGASADVWLKVSCVAIGVVGVMFVRESVGFFISKKVSILHWILYLCTVEILPFSLLWQAAKSLM